MKRMINPKLSIIIPVKNSSVTLGETLNSLLNQSYKNFNTIVVDDGSTDNSVEIAKKFRCSIIKLQKSHGAAYARNKGAENAKGDFLVFTDSDIVLFKNTLRNAIDYIKKNPNVRVFFGTFDPKLRFRNIFSQYKHLYLCYYCSKLEKFHFIDTSLTFIKKKVFDKFKFNSQIKSSISEDIELGMRLTKAGYNITNPKNIKMEHIKFYSFKDFIKTDFVRGMRISKLFLRSVFKDRRETGKKTFFLKPLSIFLNIGIMPFVLISLLFYLFLNSFIFFIIFVASFISLIMINLDFWNYLKNQRGPSFLLKSFPITFLDAIAIDLGITITFLKFLFKGKGI